MEKCRTVMVLLLHWRSYLVVFKNNLMSWFAPIGEHCNMDTYTDSSESDGRSDNEEGHSSQGCLQYKTSINIIMHWFADIFVCFIICRCTYANTWVFRGSQKSSQWWAIVPLHYSKKMLHSHNAAANHFKSWTSRKVWNK